MAKKQRKERPPQTLIDIVVPIHNRFDLLAECLTSIEEAAWELTYNIILIDNASTEEEADEFYASLELPNLNILRNQQNLGFPRACNIAANRKRSPLIFFLNSDVVLDPGSINALVQEMDNPEVGIAGMKLVFPIDSRGLRTDMRPQGKIQHIGMSFNIKIVPIHHLVGWSEDNPKVNSLRKVHAVTGAAMMVRRSVWAKLGGFDEDYGHGSFEDVDFCIRAEKLGYNTHVVPEARAVHYTGATVEKYQIGFPMQMNHLLFLNKHLNNLAWSEWQIW